MSYEIDTVANILWR